MKRIIIIIVAMLLPLAAFALDFEVSGGHTISQEPDNGIWYQKGPRPLFDHTLNNTSSSYSIGVSDYLTPSMRWRAAYVYLGNFSTNAQATPRDDQYNGVDGCVGPCPAMYTFRTEGSVRGVSLTLAPEWKTDNGIKVFLEGGLFVYLPKFYAEVAMCKTCPVAWQNEYREGWQVGPQIGAGGEIDKVQLVFMLYKIDTPTPDINATTNFKSWAANLSLRYRF